MRGTDPGLASRLVEVSQSVLASSTLLDSPAKADLEDLERRTREACKASIETLVRRIGPAAKEGWNFPYLTAGDVTFVPDGRRRLSR